MAKKQLPPERNGTPNQSSKTPHKSKTKTKTKNSPKINSKSRTKITETANGDASSEETELAVVPWSRVESENDEVAESSEAEDDGVERGSSSDEEEEEVEEEVEEEEDRGKKPKSVGKKGKKNDAKSKGKKRSRKREDEEKTESALYTFPMKRISRIIKSELPDAKISQEAVFLINRASEKFLHVFCKEAHASTLLDKKKQIAYNHLSSVVSKRQRFEFLSDFVPEKVKAGDALPQVAEAENDLD